ncbi:hypothetical protein J6590_005083 [Homalodisca vitripennis]|nr:hypothetical protein J6590_005083 [Homalodisca vitripennis]
MFTRCLRCHKFYPNSAEFTEEGITNTALLAVLFISRVYGIIQFRLSSRWDSGRQPASRFLYYTNKEHDTETVTVWHHLQSDSQEVYTLIPNSPVVTMTNGSECVLTVR